MSHATYPVSLLVAGRRALVVGGGPVAARKVAGLVECGARVTVVAPDVVAEIDARATVGALSVERRRYRRGEVADYRLVVAATGLPEVDRAVAADAEAAAIWVNCADDADHCTFFLPAVHRDGPVTVTVSTGGSSPALAAWLRRKAAAALGPGLGTLCGILDRARRRLREEGRSTSEVRWDELLDGALPELVAGGRLDEARRMVDDAVRACRP